MPWPFSRTEPASPGAGPTDAGARPNEPRDPATELRVQTRRRLIGSAVLLLAAVIVLPMLLDTTPRPVRDDIVITVASPPPEPPAKAAEVRSPVAEEKIAEPAPVRAEAEPIEPPDAKPARSAPLAATPEPAGPVSAAQPAPAPPSAGPAASKDKFVVQIVALSSSAAAGDLKARLVKGGFSAYVEAVTTTSGTLHRVRVGPFASRDEAQRAVDRLKAAGHKAAVVSG